MAILEKEVYVGFSNNLDHFESLGYTYPRVSDSKGRFSIKKGTKILVKVEDLPKSSTVKVTRICDDCDTVTYNRTYASIITLREDGDGKDRCRSCGNKRAKEIMKNSVPYEKTFKFFCDENNLTYLLEEYSENNHKSASEIYKATSDKMIWNCKKCGSEYTAIPANRVKGKNCPYCANKKVNRTNSLWATNPEVARLLTYSERGHKITSGTTKKENFSCLNCDFVQSKQVNVVSNYGISCPKCSDGISYPEKFIYSLLDQFNLKIQREKVFEWSKDISTFDKKYDGKKRYDFYIPEFNIIIETHGGQHYQEGFGRLGSSSLQEVKQNDELKFKLAINNRISDYIVIDCRFSTLDHIKESILNSNLSKYIDMNKVDWNICNQYARSTQVKEVASLWNKGNNSKEISELMKINRSTAIRYLKQSSQVGWSNYDPKKEMTKKRRNIKLEKKIVQITLDGEFVKEWESLSSVSKSMNITTGNLSKVCKGRQNSAGGYKWMYKEDYYSTQNKEAVAY